MFLCISAAMAKNSRNIAYLCVFIAALGAGGVAAGGFAGGVIALVADIFTIYKAAGG
jgi:hypothetical protein